jgi:hypothetical protein
MSIQLGFKTAALVALSSATIFTSAQAAQDTSSPGVTADQAAELQRQIDVLGQEIQKLKMGEVSGPTGETANNQPALGFGPAMSKVYHQTSGVSLGGYGEILWEHFASNPNPSNRRFAPGEAPVTSQSRASITRAVLYAGYKFDDHWVLNSEFEWENSGAEISVEFLYLDYFWKSFFNLRGGKILIPMGLTNETHEPTTYLGSHRPTLETLIIPTTWSSYGLGVFGDAGPITYRSYAVTGLNASGFSSDVGIQEGRPESGFANATQYAWVSRADYTGTPGLLAGGSFYLGSSSTDFVAGQDDLSIPTRVFEVHAQYNYKALDLRAMGAYSILSKIDQLDARKAVGIDQSIGSRQGGFYLQAGYDLLNNGKEAFIPFLRWETVDTQLEVPPGYVKNGSNLIRELVAGINYKPLPQLVFKADYQWYFLGDHSGVNQTNLAVGYVF